MSWHTAINVKCTINFYTLLQKIVHARSNTILQGSVYTTSTFALFLLHFVTYRACKAGAASRIDNACIVTRHALDSGLRSVSKINCHTHWMPLIHVSLRYKWHARQNGGVPNTTLYIIYVMDILLTQCCWWGVVFSEKAFQHSGNPTQQWKLSTEVSRSFLTETWEVAICKWNQWDQRIRFIFWDQRIRFFLRPDT